MRGLFFVLVAFGLMFSSCKEEAVVKDDIQPEENQVEVDKFYRPFVHHFSSTGCGGCGRFGIPVLSQTADEMQDSIFAMITHFKYNDVFITPSSQAIEQAILSRWHSPQIWVENEEITFEIYQLSIANAVKETKKRLRFKS